MTANGDTETEQPLDPATEKVRQKMMRLLLVSIGIMMIGLMAVLGAIVYKIGSGEKRAVADGGNAGVPVEPGFEGRLDLPDGAEIQSSDLDGDRVLLGLRLADGRRELVIYSLSDSRVVARIALD
jgi:hypothetical protein